MGEGRRDRKEGEGKVEGKRRGETDRDTRGGGERLPAKCESEENELEMKGKRERGREDIQS